jgi:glutaredoxin
MQLLFCRQNIIAPLAALTVFGQKQFLKENNIVFEEVDVSQNQQASEEMIEKSGQMGVPVLEIEGEIIVGFDREKIKQALGREKL